MTGMQIGAFEAVECEKPTLATLSRVRQIQTDLGPVEFFADSEQLYMRAWLNSDGQNEITWYRLEKS